MASIYKIKEGNSYRLRFSLVDQDGARVSSSVVVTLLCTEYYYNEEIGNGDKYHLATINSRYNQDIKNSNNVELSASGTVTWSIQPDDTNMLSTNEQELHVALFTWYWDTAPNTKKNDHEFYFLVKKVNYSTT